MFSINNLGASHIFKSSEHDIRKSYVPRGFFILGKVKKDILSLLNV